MAKFNSPHFLIAPLLLILDQATATKGIFDLLAIIFDDGQPGLFVNICHLCARIA